MFPEQENHHGFNQPCLFGIHWGYFWWNGGCGDFEVPLFTFALPDWSPAGPPRLSPKLSMALGPMPRSHSMADSATGCQMCLGIHHWLSGFVEAYRPLVLRDGDYSTPEFPRHHDKSWATGYLNHFFVLFIHHKGTVENLNFIALKNDVKSAYSEALWFRLPTNAHEGQWAVRGVYLGCLWTAVVREVGRFDELIAKWVELQCLARRSQASFKARTVLTCRACILWLWRLHTSIFSDARAWKLNPMTGPQLCRRAKSKAVSTAAWGPLMFLLASARKAWPSTRPTGTTRSLTSSFKGWSSWVLLRLFGKALWVTLRPKRAKSNRSTLACGSRRSSLSCGFCTWKRAMLSNAPTVLWSLCVLAPSWLAVSKWRGHVVNKPTALKRTPTPSFKPLTWPSGRWRKLRRSSWRTLACLNGTRMGHGSAFRTPSLTMAFSRFQLLCWDKCVPKWRFVGMASWTMSTAQSCSFDTWNVRRTGSTTWSRSWKRNSERRKKARRKKKPQRTERTDNHSLRNLSEYIWCNLYLPYPKYFSGFFWCFDLTRFWVISDHFRSASIHPYHNVLTQIIYKSEKTNIGITLDEETFANSCWSIWAYWPHLAVNNLPGESWGCLWALGGPDRRWSRSRVAAWSRWAAPCPTWGSRSWDQPGQRPGWTTGCGHGSERGT